MTDDRIRRLEAMGVPLRFRDKALDDYEVDMDSEAQAGASNWARAFDPEGLRSAILLGKPGTGKTHLAIGIMLEHMKRTNTALFCEHTANYVYIPEPTFYTTVSAAVQRVKGSWGPGNTTEIEVRESLTRPRLLVVDEVGVQFGTDFERNLFFDVLNDRYENLKPTILISNLDIDAVTKILGERIIDRFREDDGQVIVFDWESYR